MPSLFHFDFITRAFLAGGIIAIIAPLIGIFLVVRGYSLMADTLGHVSLVGVALGAIFGVNPVISATATAILAAIGIERLRSGKRIFGESILALFLSGGLALAIVLISLSPGLNINIMNFLFGSISTVSSTDLWIIGAVSLLVGACVLIFYRPFFFVSFNDELAAASGLNVKRLNLILIMLAASVVSVSLRIVGALLIGALIVIPTVSAVQLRMGFLRTLFAAIGFSIISVLTGLFASYYLNLPSGSSIVLTSLILFAGSLFFGSWKAK